MSISLKSFDIFQGIEDEKLYEIQSRSRLRLIRRTEVLRYAFDDQHAYFLVSGLLKTVAMNKNGEQLVKEFLSPGSFIGELPLIETQEREESIAIAIEPSTVIAIHLTFIRQALLDSEKFRIRIKRHIAEKMYALEDRLLDVIYKNAEERVIDLLVQLLKRFGQPSGACLRMTKFITDTDICQYVATSRQTVSQIMNDLRQKGMVSYTSTHLEVPLSSPLLL
ncbi:MAG: Crp/Fnr family transcriptional regulator [Williamsia sp.]|nr:Crp/Fnr family transcriptional regulator [Williamsia sp.]